MDNQAPTPINDYIASFPPDIQKLLEQMRTAIKEEAPDAEEVIGYGIPTFKLNGNLVHFAGYKNHIGFYPGADGIKTFIEEIAAYKNAKGSVQFPVNEPLPLDLVRRITRYRIARNAEKPQKKAKKKPAVD